MALQNFTIPNLTNGVSQQPITVRLPNQAEEQINSFCRVTDGLTKRPSSELVSIIDVLKRHNDTDLEVSPDNLFTSTILRDNVRYELIIHANYGSGSLGIGYIYNTVTQDLYNIDFSPNPFEPEPFTDYFFGNPEDFKVLDTGTDIYILNKNKVVLRTLVDNSDARKRKQGGMVYVREGLLSTKYSVTLRLFDTSDDLVDTLEFDITTGAADPLGYNTSDIAAKLATKFNTEKVGTDFDDTSFVFQTKNNWIHFFFVDGTLDGYRIEIETFASAAGDRIVSFTTRVEDPLFLPSSGPTTYSSKFVVQVKPADGTDESAYYLRWNQDEGVWEECPIDGLGESFNNTPVVISQVEPEVGENFVAGKYLRIKGREAGDSISNKTPSFYDKKINDIFLFNNRLGFLSKNNIILSKIDEYDVFFLTTLSTLLTSDRIDLTATIASQRYSELLYAVPLDRELIIFGEISQYSLTSTANVFSATSASLVTLTSYKTSRKSIPRNVGNSIYFANERNNYSAIFNLQQVENIAGLGANEVTQHVPTYIEGTIIDFAFSSTENVTFVRSTGDYKTIYVQNRFVRGSTVEQNAWHKWVLPHEVVGMYVEGRTLYLTMIEDSFEEGPRKKILVAEVDIGLNLIKPSTGTVIEFLPFLDLIQRVPQGTTVEDLNLPESLLENLQGIDDSGFIYKGVTAIDEALVDNEIWVGVPFKFSYTFSEQVPAAYTNNNKTPFQYAQLVLKSMKISYVNTGKFDIIVSPTGRDSFTTRFTGSILGLASSILGKINIATGVFRFPVNCRANSVKITIESDYPYPCTFNTCEWQGTVVNKSGRL